MLFDII